MLHWLPKILVLQKLGKFFLNSNFNENKAVCKCWYFIFQISGHYRTKLKCLTSEFSSEKGYFCFHRISLNKRSCYFEKWIEYVINFRLRTKTEENFILWKFNFLRRHIFREYFYFIISSTKRAGNFMILSHSIIVIEQFRLRLHIIIIV